MLLVTSAINTHFSISQNGINTITLNKQIGNPLNMDIIIASRYLVVCNLLFIERYNRGIKDYDAASFTQINSIFDGTNKCCV